MRPRIIKETRPGNGDRGPNPPRGQKRATVVIADSGEDAEVLVFPPGEAVHRGAEFLYRGTTWVITGARRDSGILVAEPAPH